MCWLTLWPKHQWHTTDIKWERMKCRKYQGHISWTHHQQTTEAKQEERNTINASLSPSLEAQIWKKHSFLEKMKFNYWKDWFKVLLSCFEKLLINHLTLYIQQNKTVYLLQHVIHFFFDTFGKYILIQGILLRDLLIANKQ